MRSHAPLPIRILTHNIRYATSSPFPGELPWADRKTLIVNELKYNTLHCPEAFICLQEVLHEQLLDILAGLNGHDHNHNHLSPSRATNANSDNADAEPQITTTSEWHYIGVGRDDGLRAGEYSPILFRPRIWSLTTSRTLWLSPTPSRPSKGWDAASIRIVTIGTFMHRSSKRGVVGMSTHFDEQGAVARRESAKMIGKLVADFEKEDADTGVERSVFLAGDLNSQPEEEAYQLLNAPESLLHDAKERAGWRYGNEITCTGFQEEMRQVIDFVFLGKKGWGVEGYAVLPNRWDEGVYGSDHRAVVVDAVLE